MPGIHTVDRFSNPAISDLGMLLPSVMHAWYMRALSKVHGAVVQDIIYMAKKALLVEGA
jgi:hypothetical protein